MPAIWESSLLQPMHQTPALAGSSLGAHSVRICSETKIHSLRPSVVEDEGVVSMQDVSCVKVVRDFETGVAQEGEEAGNIVADAAHLTCWSVFILNSLNYLHMQIL